MSDTNTRAAEVRAMRDAATPGPWQTNGSHFYGPDPDCFLVWSMWGGGPFDANLALISAAPTLATELADALDELARVRIHVARLTGFVGGAAEGLSHGDIMARKASDGLAAEVARFDEAQSELESKP